MSFFSSLIRGINSLLPFTQPGTPLLQDFIHTAVLCTILYFGPQLQSTAQHIIQQWWKQTVEIIDESLPRHPEQPASDTADDVRRVRHAVVESDDDSSGASEAGANAADGEILLDEIPTAPMIPQEGVGEGDADGVADAADRFAAAQQDHAAAADRIRTDRNVGAKKAKSLQRRQQIRAYHEFQRSLGDAQRQRDAEAARAVEDEQREARERREEVEKTVKEKERRERERRRLREEKALREQADRRESVINAVSKELDRTGHVDIAALARKIKITEGATWAENVIKASGLLGTGTVQGVDATTILTKRGWIVRIDERTMAQAYRKAEQRMDNEERVKLPIVEFGEILEEVILKE